ncbi:MAG: phosphotransferase [Planctomycetota bacterium]|nr:phosphotransferase [Planctomycetota bacterium]MDA1105621.1 phosphotransferase [Planctomycetota bacterium]
MSSSRARETFSADEVSMVVHRFALSRVTGVSELAIGSSRSPKLVIRTEGAAFLLKRRADDAAREERVRFTQSVQLELERRGVSVPRLMRTSGGGAPALQADGQIYEVFEFVEGESYQSSPVQAESAGRALGLLHVAMLGWVPPVPTPKGNYHAASSMERLVERARSTSITLAARARMVLDQAAFTEAMESIASAYRIAGTRVDLGDRGLSCVNHADFHPGNAIFASDGSVRALVDFDSARMEDPILDVANGLLQFGHVRHRGADPRTWPVSVDDTLTAAFTRGYVCANAGAAVAERANAIPWLMVEAAVAESIVALARRGRLGPVAGPRVVEYLRTRVDWLVLHAGRISRLVRECASAGPA